MTGRGSCEAAVIDGVVLTMGLSRAQRIGLPQISRLFFYHSFIFFALFLKTFLNLESGPSSIKLFFHGPSVGMK